MSKVSSLIKSAQSAQRRAVSYEKQVAAFEWSLSAKTFGDYLDYVDFLQGMADTAETASDALTIQNTIKSARRSYQSAEIQRENINIMLGNQDLTGKYNAVLKLYNDAISIGDFDQAQNLANNLYQIDLQLQAEAEKAQRSAYAASANRVKETKEWRKLFENGNPDLGGYIETADGPVKSYALINQEFAATGSANYWEEMQLTTEALQEQMNDMLSLAKDQDEYDDILDEYETAMRNIPTAAGDMTWEELNLAVGESRASNEMYTAQMVSKTVMVDGKPKVVNQFEMNKNEVDDFVWIRNEDGTYAAVQSYIQEGSQTADELLSSRFTDDGKFVRPGEEGYGQATSISDRLASAGITIQTGEDGKYVAILPDGSSAGYPVEITILPGGRIRFFGGPNQFSGEEAGLYEVDVLQLGENTPFDMETQMRAVSPDEISDFGDDLSAPSKIGKGNLASILGLIKRPNLSLVGAEMGGYGQIYNKDGSFTAGSLTGVPLRSDYINTGRVSDMLGRAMIASSRVQEQKRMQLQAQQQAMIQGSKTPGLNQTPVRQIASSGQQVNQLEVKPFVPPTTNLQVMKPKPTPTVQVGPTNTQPSVNVYRGPGQTFTGQVDQYGNQIKLGTF